MFINFLFIFSAIFTIACALGVLFLKNIMHACVALLGSLLGVAGLYVTLGADFVAVSQIMVYVGGVVILMLFAVMLTGGVDFKSKIQELFNLAPNMGNKFTYSLAFISAILFLATLSQLIYGIIKNLKQSPTVAFSSTVEALGKSLMTEHVLAFEISSVLLLGSLIGAAIISRPKVDFIPGHNSSEDHSHD